MATANDEFEDLMPHQIKVYGAPTKYDDNGKPIQTTGERNYRCLVDDSSTTVRNFDGTEVTIAMTAYVAPVPLESNDGVPVDIEADEIVEFVSPRQQTRKVVVIQRHYDSTLGVGELHNIVLGFR